MGRHVKRVPIWFDWPLEKVWFGYTDFAPVPCQLCGGTGKKDGGERGWCPTCRGEGKVYAQVEPPEGSAYQMWEDCSEGSPISPPFKTPQELARWLADSRASAFADMTASYEDWLGMIGVGESFSALMGPSGFQSGVSAVAQSKRRTEDGETATEHDTI